MVSRESLAALARSPLITRALGPDIVVPEQRRAPGQVKSGVVP
jgi:hypothetical protein